MVSRRAIAEGFLALLLLSTRSCSTPVLGLHSGGDRMSGNLGNHLKIARLNSFSMIPINCFSLHSAL